MSTRPDLETILDNHIAAWIDIPCALIRDNEPSRSDDYTEWMRLTVGDGFSFVQESAGLQDVAGSSAAHPFVLSFDIFTPKNAGTNRAAVIGQAVSDYWAYMTFGNILLHSASFERISEQDAIYHTAVTVSAVRYETLAARG